MGHGSFLGKCKRSSHVPSWDNFSKVIKRGLTGTCRCFAFEPHSKHEARVFPEGTGPEGILSYPSPPTWVGARPPPLPRAALGPFKVSPGDFGEGKGRSWRPSVAAYTEGPPYALGTAEPTVAPRRTASTGGSAARPRVPARHAFSGTRKLCPSKENGVISARRGSVFSNPNQVCGLDRAQVATPTPPQILSN